MTTLTLGWIHTADCPRLLGSPVCLTHVLLSNRVLMASRGISCEGTGRNNRFSFRNPMSQSHYPRVFFALLQERQPRAKWQTLQGLRGICAVSSCLLGPLSWLRNPVPCSGTWPPPSDSHRADLSSHELTHSWWKGEWGDDKGNNSRIQQAAEKETELAISL